MPLKAQVRCACAAVCIATGFLVAGCATEQKPYVETKVPSDPAGLLQLAKDGDATAANNLGVLYANGAGVPQDFTEAKKWFDFASQHGNSAGEYGLAVAYQRGLGTPANLPEALKHFRLAADHNFPPAKFALALMYQNGIGVPRDTAEATRLVQDAALQGLPMAQGVLAVLYSEGNGVPEDDSLAYEWASLAAAKLTGADGALSKKVRDIAAQGLSAVELTAAQVATASWKPGVALTSVFPPNGPPRPLRRRGVGSGFVVGKNGEIATDFHVVPNCREIKLIDPAGKFNVTTHIIADDRSDDLALLAGGGFGTRLKIRAAPAELGEAITSYGFPLGPVLSSSGNLATGSVSSATGFQGNVKAFQISAPEQAGASGGPVVDGSGAVIGLVASKLNALAVAAATGDLAQNVNFAWRIGLLKTLMDQKGIAYEEIPKGHARAAVDLAGLLQKATVKIECWR